ncbi:hypothetical protein, partial [Kitasatospora sp. MBT66]|uniref:hypothetical protein n=1 Tax=Kitasatospora sp. MBT66 TaxID=1444769 RepID=UPI001313E09E
SNYDTAKRWFAEECGPIGERWDDTGWIMYDADAPTAVALAERITGTLHGYPLLDDDDHSEREHAAMLAEIDQEMPGTYPDDVDASDVFRELGCPELGRITSDDVTDAMQSLGYTPCSDCDEWLTPMTTRCGEPLCRDCALEESRPAESTTVPIP